MKKLLAVCLSAALFLGIAGCAPSDPSASKEEKTLNLFTWQDYVPDDTIKAFEAKTGISVNYTNFSTNEEMYAKLKAVKGGDYDIVIASDYIFQTMAAEGGLMTEIDQSKISNYKNISESYLNKNFDPGNKYTVPYATGCILLAYNEKKSPISITGYRDLLNPALKNQVVCIDEMRAVVGMMNLMLGNDLNETDPAKLEEAKNALLLMAPNIVAFNSDKPHETMLAGDASVGLMYSSQVSAAVEENPDIKVVYPQEGIGIGIDSICIPANAPHKDAAYQFIDFVNDPEVNANIMPQIKYGTTNKEAMKLLPEAFKADKAINVPEDLTKNSQIVIDVGETTEVYSDIWNTFKTSKQ